MAMSPNPGTLTVPLISWFVEMIGEIPSDTTSDYSKTYVWKFNEIYQK